LSSHLFIVFFITVCLGWSQEAFVTQWLSPWYHHLQHERCSE
jgi:hypothetical protein